MTTQPITDQERDEAREIIATDNGGAGLDVHGRGYFAMVADWPADAVPVRSETGGILGYTLQSVTEEIERLMDEERGYLDLADAATEPELAGAHRAIAQNYRLARMTRETDQAYTAQTFKVAAQGWENLMPGALSLVYMGKSQGMWPRQRAQKDAAETELAAKRLLDQAVTQLAKRTVREAAVASAAKMTDDQLAEAIERTKSAPDATAFLAYVRERDTRNETLRKARAKTLKAAASGAPWTEDEERMLTATAKQTAGMADAKLREFHARPYSTRREELQREAVLREIERRGI